MKKSIETEQQGNRFDFMRSKIFVFGGMIASSDFLAKLQSNASWDLRKEDTVGVLSLF